MQDAMRIDACYSARRLPSLVRALRCRHGCANAADGHTDDQPYGRAHSDTDDSNGCANSLAVRAKGSRL